MISQSNEVMLLAEQTRQKIDGALYLLYPEEDSDTRMKIFIEGKMLPMAADIANRRDYFNLARLINQELRVTALTEQEVCAFLAVSIGGVLSPMDVLIRLVEKLCGHCSKHSLNFFTCLKDTSTADMQAVMLEPPDNVYGMSQQVVQKRCGVTIEDKEAFEVLSSVLSYQNLLFHALKGGNTQQNGNNRP